MSSVYNYRVIAYDRRGCGESGDAADGRYDLAAQAADLQAVIEHIGAPANVLAHSAGTLVALELLRVEPRHNRRVRSCMNPP